MHIQSQHSGTIETSFDFAALNSAAVKTLSWSIEFAALNSAAVKT